jgi:hypothetical protein
MLVPIPRGLTEGLLPKLTLLDHNPALKAEYTAWEAGRRGFLTDLKANEPEAVKRGWQKDYFQGKTSEGSTFDRHQTKLTVRPFAADEPSA